jgi:hypothetical protein
VVFEGVIQDVIAAFDASGTQIDNFVFIANVCTNTGLKLLSGNNNSATNATESIRLNRRRMKSSWKFIRGGGLCRFCSPDDNDIPALDPDTGLIVEANATAAPTKRKKKAPSTSHAFRTVEVQLAGEVRAALKRSKIKCIKGLDLDVYVTLTPTDSLNHTLLECPSV